MRILIFVLFVFLVGCPTTEIGNDSAKTMSDSLVLGVTTKNEVRNTWGRPDVTEVSAKTGYEYWKYQYLEIDRNNAVFIPIVGAFVPRDDLVETNRYVVKLQFDKKGVLIDYKKTADMGVPY